MKSDGHGTVTLAVEVVDISSDGFRLKLGQEELVVNYGDFPWFRGVPISKVARVELAAPDHLYWPDLDIDLEVESLRHPESFPLVARA